MRILLGLIFPVVLGLSSSGFLAAQQSSVARAVPWTTSKVKGSPDPPLPYKTVRVFEGVKLDQPTDVTWLPQAERFIATQVNGELFAFENDPKNATAEAFLDMNRISEQVVMQTLAIKFHHDLENQPWCFVTYSSRINDQKATHLGRLKVLDPSVPTVDPASLVVLASWSGNGHTGGSMQFGPDGMLYLSVGDGQPPYPPDELNTGQDLSVLESSVLRIDVDNPTPGNEYRIPPDNPFVGQPNVKEEIWAYGFRNPWKMAFDPDSGDLLAADVGWEMREMIHRVARGRNHGWSITEGSQPVKQDLKPVIPITPPLFEHTHVDSRSISGGYFWQSDRLPELKGAYIYGDWMTGKVWALKPDGDRVQWQKELVDTPNRVICFMLDPTGEVFIVGYDGTVLRLETNDVSADSSPFPVRLSETGLFADVVSQDPAPGVVEYAISAHHWADGTQSRQWIAIPGSEQLQLYDRNDWKTGQTVGRFDFPSDTVVAKTVSYLTDPSDVGTEKRIETQLLHRLGDEWQAYNYIWNDDQTDALLQDDLAIDRLLEIKDAAAPEGMRTQTWRHSSRSECMLCHIWAAGTVHAFWPEQLNISYLKENQLDRLTRMGIFKEPIPKLDPLPSPHDTSQKLQARARSYLALNCSTCHRPQGGGTANFNFDITLSLLDNKYVDAPPAQGTFEITDARVVAPGDPHRSVLLYRALKSGRGHMPQFGSNVIDRQGIRLLRDWILSMSSETTGQSEKTGQQTSAESEIVGKLTNLTEPDQLDQKLASLLESTPDAIALSLACSDPNLSDELKERIIQTGISNDQAMIRDLFEHYLPENKRIKRLGPTVDEEALLAVEGSAERGRQLFEQAKDINCRLCHRIGSVGKTVGPDLSGIGTQQTAAELLASLVRPSERIDAKYRTRQILTHDGEVIVGMVTEETPQTLTIADATGKLLEVATDDIELIQPSSKSVMPEQLLSGMTSAQAADLLAYLRAQRKIGPLQHKQATVHRTKMPIVIDGKLDEIAWDSAPTLGDFVFTWSNEVDGERQQTDARMLWDDKTLYVSFKCFDKDVVATRTQRDSDVYRDDCVEVFASPEIDHPEHYFNIEMNALGTTLDNYRPQGTKPESAWDPDGIRCSVSVDGTINDSSDVDRSWTLEVAIPFRLFSHVIAGGHPKPGDRWRLNLNRLEDNMAIKSQWSQGDRNAPSFHAPDFFGFIEFAE